MYAERASGTARPGDHRPAGGLFGGLALPHDRADARTFGPMSAPDPELKKELDATLQTRRELGPEYESMIGTVRNVGYRFVTPTEEPTRVSAG